MNCGGRLYKGSDAILAVPFNEDYDTIEIHFYTDGEYNIERSGSGVTVEDGYAVVAIQDYELDLLKTGPIYYNIKYTKDGYDLGITANSSYFLKAAVAYSAQTPGEIYERGYEEGLEQCSHIQDLIQSAKSVNMLTSTAIVTPSSGYIGMAQVNVNATQFGQVRYNEGVTVGRDTGFQQGYSSGHTDGIAEQKAKLGRLGISTNNSSYTNPDGWSSVTVNVSNTHTWAGWYITGSLTLSQDFQYGTTDLGGRYNCLFDGNYDPAYSIVNGEDEFTMSVNQTLLSAGTYSFRHYMEIEVENNALKQPIIIGSRPDVSGLKIDYFWVAIQN